MEIANVVYEKRAAKLSRRAALAALVHVVFLCQYWLFITDIDSLSECH